MYRLRTLGGVLIEGPAGPLTGAASQRRRLAVLALLAASGSGISRDRLVALLWPENDEERARHALAQLLYALRRDLGTEAVTGSATALRLDPASVSSDVQDFVRAIADGDHEHAVALYGGPFLDGFHLGGCPDFERWMEEERARLLQSARRAIEALASRAAQAGDRAAAVRWWQRLAALDPVDARVALELMQALAATGDRAAALRHARAYDVLVRDELGASPDAAIVDFARRLASLPAAPPPDDLLPSGAADASSTAHAAGERAPPFPVPAQLSSDPAGGPDIAGHRGEEHRRPGHGFETPARSAFARSRLARHVAIAAGIGAIAALAFLAVRGWGGTGGLVFIVLSEVENTTGETIFDGSVPIALSVGLGQSAILRVVPPQRVRETLVRMRRADTSSVLDEATAREVAIREYARFVLVPAVHRSGQGFEISGRLVDPETGSVLALETESAAGHTAVIDALDRLAKRLRRSAGESARAVETRSTPLPRLTTHSLGALEKYAHGARAFNGGQWAEAEALWRDAVQLDSGFATAQAALGMHAYFTNRAVEGEARFARAIAAVDGLAAREQTMLRVQIEGWRGNRDSAVALLRSHLFENPNDIDALGQLGYDYLRLARHREAMEIFRRLLHVDSLDVFVLINLATVEKALGEYDSAIAHYRRAFARDPDRETENSNINLEYGSTWVLAGQLDSAAAVFAKMLTKGRDQRARGLRSNAFLAMYRGHYAEAASDLTEAIRLNRLSQAATSEVRNRLLLAACLTHRGLARESLEQLDSATALAARFDADPILMYWLGKALARTGEPERADRILSLLDARRHPSNVTGFAASEALRGEIIVARGSPDLALIHLETALNEDSTANSLESLAHGVASAGQLERARTLYQELARSVVFGSEGQEMWRLSPFWLGRLAEQAGDARLAVREYERFLENWRDAEPALPVLIEVRNRLIELRATGG